MSEKYKILFLEDCEAEASRLQLKLKENNIEFDYVVADTETRYVQALEEFCPDIIVSDRTFSSLNSFEALKLLRQKELNIPFVVVSPADNIAKSIVKEDAESHVFKDCLQQLPKAVVNAIEDCRFERDNKQKIDKVCENGTLSKEALLQLSDKFLLATKSAGMGVWDWNIETGSLYWDDGMHQLYNTDESEFNSVYDGWLSRLHPEDKPRANDEVQRAITGEKQYNIEFRVIWKDLSVHYIRSNGVVERDESGKAVKMIGINQDVTKQKAIEESNLFKAEILKNIGQSVVCIDMNGIITYCNKAAEATFGWTIEEQIGAHIRDRGPAEEMKEIALAGFAELFKGNSWSGELLMQRKDGTKFIAFVTDTPLFDKNNKQTGVIAIATDVTERKKAEERILEMQEQLLASQTMAKIGSWHRNIEPGTEMQLNPMVYSAEALRIIGFEPNYKEMTYEKFVSLTHPEDIEMVKEASEKMYNGVTSYYNVEHRIITPDGIVKWVRRDAKLIKGEDTERPVKIIGTIKDITVTKLQELELEKNSKERAKLLNDLLVRNKSLEQFAYIVSHNLRAPVANILGIAEMITDPDVNGERKVLLNNGISESVQKLDAIVKDLNYILQVKKEHQELKETVHISTFVEDIKVSIKHIITDDVNIAYDFTEVNEFFTIRSYMYSIFYNLILNSIKYRRQEIPCIITIKSRLANNHVILLFTDNGMGIDLSLRGEDVFGLYKRFHTNIEGKGMGLFMVKTQVEAIGGRISIDSEVNKGTTFKIEFDL